jgi:N-methylhydantoinase A
LRRVTRDSDPAEIASAWEELEAQARDQLAMDGLAAEQMRVRRSAALHYKGQSFDLVVPAPSGDIDEAYMAGLSEAFGVEHERMYGHRAGPEEPVELVSIQVLGIGLREGGGVPEHVVSSRPEPAIGPPREVYFGPDIGWLETPIVRRSDLATQKSGPLIVEEYDATCVITPGATAELDAGGNIAITLV